MSKKRDKEKRKRGREDGCEAACDELFEEAFDEDVEDLDFLDEDEGVEFNTPFMSPMQGKKVWIVLASILVVVAVAVLYVYQAGDRKTILGNQPIPVGQPNQGNTPVAAGVQNLPTGGGVQNAFNTQTNVRGVGAARSVQCPRCSMTGLPVCTACGTVMEQIGDGSGLFACPSCGSVGIPICPNCQTQMKMRTAGIPQQAAMPF